MKVNKFGFVTGYTQQDLNHCYSSFFVRANKGVYLANGLADAIRIGAFFGEFTIQSCHDIYTWDPKTQTDRRIYCAETKRVGFHD